MLYLKHEITNAVARAIAARTTTWVGKSRDASTTSLKSNDWIKKRAVATVTSDPIMIRIFRF